MKTKFLPQLFILAFFSFSLYSCTADSDTDTKSQNSEAMPSNLKAPTNVTAEDIIVKPK